MRVKTQPTLYFRQSPSAAQGQARHLGRQSDLPTLDEVAGRYGIADVQTLVSRAQTLSPVGGYLSRAGLSLAAEKLLQERLGGQRWSPTTFARILQAQEQPAAAATLLCASRSGAPYLNADKLAAAARAIERLVPPNDLKALYARIEGIGARADVRLDTLGYTRSLPVFALHLPARRRPRLRVLVTAGVHGDEPGGVAAAMHLLEGYLDDVVRGSIELTFIPVVNPKGFASARRRNGDGIDLNRSFKDSGRRHDEAQLVASYLADKSFDLAIDLHTGRPSRKGFWALHECSEELVEAVMPAFAERWPVMSANTTKYSFSMPGVAVSSNPRTLKSFTKNRGARWSVTLEAPRSLSHADQAFGEAELAERLIEAALLRS